MEAKLIVSDVKTLAQLQRDHDAYIVELQRRRSERGHARNEMGSVGAQRNRCRRSYSPALSHWPEQDFRKALGAPTFPLNGRQRKQYPKVSTKIKSCDRMPWWSEAVMAMTVCLY
jgi:hypothetical protein